MREMGHEIARAKALSQKEIWSRLGNPGKLRVEKKRLDYRREKVQWWGELKPWGDDLTYEFKMPSSV